MEMLKILLVGGDAGKSGVPKYISELYSVLSHYYCVKVISDKNRGGYDSIPSDKYIQIEGLASGSNFMKKINAFLKLKRKIGELRPDIIWANSSISVLFARALCSILYKRIPLIVTYHGTPFGPGRKFIRNAVALPTEYLSVKFGRKHHIITISETDHKLVNRYLPSSKFIKVTKINNPAPNVKSKNVKSPIDCTRFKLLMTTRESYQKNLEFAAQVARSVQKFADIDIYGEVSEATKNSLTTGSNITNIEFKGVIDEPMDVIERYDAYLMTSRYEGFSLGMLEAAAHGLAIISTSIGGLDEISNSTEYVLKIDNATSPNADEIQKFLLNYRYNANRSLQRKRIEELFGLKRWERQNLKLIHEILQ